MKAITLHEPWATAVARGLKSYETRHWKTKYRGWIAIHAAAIMPAYAWKFYLDNQDNPFFKSVVGWIERGYVVAVARLTEVIPITSSLRDSVTEKEKFWGDWRDDRYAWRLEDVVRLPKPIAAKGRQMIWECEKLGICEICGGPGSRHVASCTCTGGIRIVSLKPTT